MSEPAPIKAQKSSKTFKALVGVFLLFIITFIVLLTYYLYVTNSLPFFKNIQTPKVTPNEYQNPFEATAGAEYKNPFREGSEYENPFKQTDENVEEQKEYVNPFKNLGGQ